MAIAWQGAALTDEILNLGPLALIQPLLQRLDVAGVIEGTELSRARPSPVENAPGAPGFGRSF